MACPWPDKIVEKRQEEMVSPSGSEPTLRTAHFLTPSISSIDGPVFHLPSNAFSPATEFNYSESGMKSAPKVNFQGWRCPQKDWKTWVGHMCSLHRSLWKKAGIFYAIMNSTHRIIRDHDLIFGIAERWCPETNTFVFPWGEATITLEDMMILGGYSVIGQPVFSPIDTEEFASIEKKLLLARSDLTKTKSKKASQSLWLLKFINSGSEIEHEAFLTLWLSRFVFPTKSRADNIERHVIPVAIHLARGTKIALAPAVLASLYANLSELKGSIVGSKKLQICNEQDKIFELSISAPFQLVQIWVWERFSTLQPKPIALRTGQDQPRFAKWDDLKMENTVDVKFAIDEAVELFHWRPYAKGCKSSVHDKIYKEKEQWALVGSDMDEEVEVLVRCLRVSELVGIDSDCIMQYLPHRVAMQFGIDQDLPGHVARSNLNRNLAWENYSRIVGDEWLYIPSHLFEADATTRYVEWWKNSMSAQCGDTNAFVTGVKGLKKKILLNSPLRNSVNNSLASCSVPLKCNIVRAHGLEGKKAYANRVGFKNLGIREFSDSDEKISDNDAPVPPGFPPKPNRVRTRESEDKDGQIQAQRMRELSGGKGKTQNVVRLTGSEYKKAISNKVQQISAEKKLENDAPVPPFSPPKCSTLGTRYLEDEEGWRHVKYLRDESYGKDKAENIVRLTGSEYKEAYASEVNSKSLGSRMLLFSARMQSDNAALFPRSFPPVCNTERTRDSNLQDREFQAIRLRNGSDGMDKAQKESQMKSPVSSIDESIIVQSMQVQPLENKSEKGKEKDSSKTLMGHETESRPGVHLMDRFTDCRSRLKPGGADTQPFCPQSPRPRSPVSTKGSNGAEAVLRKRFGSDRGNGESCSVCGFEDQEMNLKSRMQYLESIIAVYKEGQ